jgi:hypothetical protein
MAPDELRPLYDKVDALQGQISHLSGEMRANMATISATLSERCTTRGERLQGVIDDHEDTKARVTVLEQDKHRVVGGWFASSIIGGVLVLIGTLALKFWTGK